MRTTRMAVVAGALVAAAWTGGLAVAMPAAAPPADPVATQGSRTKAAIEHDDMVRIGYGGVTASEPAPVPRAATWDLPSAALGGAGGLVFGGLATVGVMSRIRTRHAARAA